MLILFIAPTTVVRFNLQVHALCLVYVHVIQVADCVCLMSLDKPGAVPIDTHVEQIAKRDYGFVPEKGQKTLTDKVYNEIGE